MFGNFFQGQKAQLRSLNVTKNTVHQLQRRFVNLNEEFEEKRKEESYLREELQKKVIDLTELANDYQTLVKINKELEMKIEAGLGAEERKELEEIVYNLQFENKALLSDIKSNEEVVAKLENDVQSLATTIKAAKSENIKLRDAKASFESYKVEHEHFMDRYESMERELNEMKFTNKELDEELNNLYQKEDGNREEVRKACEDKQNLENDILTKGEKLKNVENELVSVTKKLTMLQMGIEKERNQVCPKYNIPYLLTCVLY